MYLYCTLCICTAPRITLTYRSSYTSRALQVAAVVGGALKCKPGFAIHRTPDGIACCALRATFQVIDSFQVVYNHPTAPMRSCAHCGVVSQTANILLKHAVSTSDETTNTTSIRKNLAAEDYGYAGHICGVLVHPVTYTHTPSHRPPELSPPTRLGTADVVLLYQSYSAPDEPS